MTEWLGLIGALAGTAIGGYVTYRVGEQRYKYERRSENEKRLVVAFESIHELLSQLSSQASTLNLGVIGHLGHNSPIKSDILNEKIQLDRLRMLVAFYAPSLKGDVKEISEKLTTISRAVGEAVLNKTPTEEWRGKTVETSTVASMELTKLALAAQEKLAEQFRAVVIPS